MEIATPPAVATVEPHSARRAMAPPSRFGDKAFEWLTLAMAMAVVVLVILLGWELWRGSSLAIKKFGFHFLTTSTRSEEHTSELQSRVDLVCRLLLEKKKK